MTYELTFYRKHGTWCYTDDHHGVVDEPLVDGADVIFDHIADLESPEQSVVAVAVRFAGSDTPPAPELPYVLQRMGAPRDGEQDYLTGGTGLPMEPPVRGWLCAHLFDYFPHGTPHYLQLAFRD